MKLGTRGSALALAQAATVAQAIPGAQLETIISSGDRGREAGDDKERWVRELDEALLDGRIELAVHSAKDLPARLTEGLVIAATATRADPFDVLCGAESIEALPPGARVGTNSLRRAAQLMAIRDDIEICELHGNIDTRLDALAEGRFDAIVLALAGLQRLQRTDEAGARLDQLVPAAGQGTLAITARSGDSSSIEAAAGLNDEATGQCLTAERALVESLDSDCHTPVGAYATLDDGTVTLEAFVGRPDGSVWLRDRLAGVGELADPSALGHEVGRRMLAAGAAGVLGR